MDSLRIAIVDLYDNEPNQGMRCIQELVENCNNRFNGLDISYHVYETRFKGDTPGLDYDAYISTGGPGSPFDGEGSEWERRYFDLIDNIWQHNQKTGVSRKHLFFICHSFQMMCRFFNLGTIQRRRSYSFGILPINRIDQSNPDWLLKGLPETYYAADFRQFEVVHPDQRSFDAIGARLISREQKRIFPELPLAMMAIRISEEMSGTQYHPEADPLSMLHHFREPERRTQVLAEYGEEKYYDMIAHLEDATNILLTRRTVLPGFLNNIVKTLRPEVYQLNLKALQNGAAEAVRSPVTEEYRVLTEEARKRVDRQLS